MHGKHQSSKRAAEARIAEKLSHRQLPDFDAEKLAALNDPKHHYWRGKQYQRKRVTMKLKLRKRKEAHRSLRMNQPVKPERVETRVYPSREWDFLRNEKMGVVD